MMNNLEFLQWATPMLIGAVAFFLHQLVRSVKDMAKDIGDIKVTIAAHATKVDDMGDRVDKLESKLTEYDSSLRDFYRTHKPQSSQL